MAKVPNAVEILPKIWTAWVGRTSVTDNRHTTDTQTTDGRAIASSEREREFTWVHVRYKPVRFLTGLLNSKNSLFETTCMWQNISVLTIYCTAKNRSAEYIFTTGRESSRGTVREMPDKSLRRRCKLEMRRTIKSYTYVRCNVSLNGHRLARWSTWLRRLFLLFLFLFRCPNHLCHRAVFTTLSRSSSLPWCSVVSPVKSPSPVRIPLVNIPRDHVVFFFYIVVFCIKALRLKSTR